MIADNHNACLIAALVSVLTPLAVAQPNLTSFSPSAGDGPSQTFTTVYSDTNGSSDVLSTQVIINNTSPTTPATSCMFGYNSPTNSFLLMKNDGSGWMPSGVPVGSSATITNSQCTLVGTGSTVTMDGDQLVATYNIVFQASFAGPKTIWTNAYSRNYRASPYASAGTWSVPGTLTPALVSLSPTTGNGPSQTFSTIYYDTAGASDVLSTQVIINATTTMSFPKSCMFGFDVPSNKFLMIKDDGSGWMPGGVPLGSSASISNSQCTLLGTGSTVNLSGNQFTATYNIVFQTGFAGPKTVWTNSYSKTNSKGSPYVSAATWTVPGVLTPALVALYPTTGNGPSQTFSTIYYDTAGASDVLSTQVIINATTTMSFPKSCMFGFDVPSNKFLMIKDDGSGWMPGGVPLGSSASISNSQCTLLGTGSTVNLSGNQFTATYNIVFQTGFAGPKTVWTNSYSKTNSKGAPYVRVATWTVLPSVVRSVLTYHYDNGRTGQNPNEVLLTPRNVNAGGFGKVFSQPVDGYIYAQPLYVRNVAIPNRGMHNVVFVATEADSVYAFDADGNSVYAFDAEGNIADNANPLWHASLIDSAHGAAPGAKPVPFDSLANVCSNIVPQVGITSTPVIDPIAGRLYVEAVSIENGTMVHRLHALNIFTADDAIPAVVVAGSVQGVPFNAHFQLSRPGLLLLNGTVYLGFGSYGDGGPAQGWVFAYNAQDLAQIGSFVTTNDPTALASVWMGGSGIAGDNITGQIFFSTGNWSGQAKTTYETYPTVPYANTVNYPNSILSLVITPSGLRVHDWFTPFNVATLDGGDVDLSSGGVVLLPDQLGPYAHLLAHAGKEGRIYLINRDQMTQGNQHFCGPPNVAVECGDNTNDSQIAFETSPHAVGSGTSNQSGIYGAPVYWNGMLFFWGGSDALKAFPIENATIVGEVVSSDPPEQLCPDNPLDCSGDGMSVSANGTIDGIVWSIETDRVFVTPSRDQVYNFNPNADLTGIVKAHAATPISGNGIALALLYSSESNRLRDDPGGAVKFSVPMVVNGKVYVGTANQVSVYGLLQ